MKRKLLFLLLCVLFVAPYSQAQQKPITGTVTGDNSEPLTGVAIVIKGTTIGTVTGADGRFSLNAPSDAVLVVSFIGYKTMEVSTEGKTYLTVTLQEDKKLIDEVVVVGYGTQKRVNLTGAVATVDISKAIGTRPITDLARGLQGSSPGLLITTSSGNIGQSPEIHIRGLQGSINAEAKPLILLDNVQIPNIMMINPDDIESVSVLKDAASASIYGARGTWGVILLTSKKGAKGGTRVSYENNFAWSAPINTPKIADGADGVEYMLKLYRRTAPNTVSFNILGAYYDDLSVERIRQWKSLYSGMDLENEMVEGRDFERRSGQVYYYRPYDVDKLFLNPSSPQMRHNLSISGGNEKTTYYGSFGFLDQKGLVKVAPDPDQYTRFNGSIRIESKINNWFTMRGSLMNSVSSKTTPNFRLANGNAKNEYWYNVFRYPETYPYGTFNGLPLKNILTELQQANMNKDQDNFARIQLGTTITFLKGWTADIDYTYATNNSHSKISASPITGINSWKDPTLTAVEANFFPAEDYVIQNSEWNSRNVGKAFTTYEKQLKEHHFKLMAGMDIEYFKSEFQYSKANGVMLPSKPELNLTSGTQFANGYPSDWSTLGFFGRINYSLKDKYLFEANIRKDGSSRFPKNHKWGTFPSASAGYIISNEKFMDGIKDKIPLTFLKLRGSWGSIGNNNVGGNSYLRIMSAGKSNWWINGLNPTMINVFGNIAESLTWETVETIDLGLNAKFFDDALDVEFDWFNRSTKDMVTTGVELPVSLGATPSERNFGVLETKGWELSVSYDKILVNGLGINMTATLSDETGKITKFANTEVNIKSGGNDTPNYLSKTMGEIWGYTTDRLFTDNDFSGNDGAANPVWTYASGVPNQDATNTSSALHYGPGDVKYLDKNSDGVVDFGAGTNLSPGDMSVIGNTTPRYIYGFRLGLSFKGFDFSGFLQGVGKRDYWATGALFVPGFVAGEAVYQYMMDYWTPERPLAYYPRPYNPTGNNHNFNFQPQTRFLLNMAYLRLKNITVGYVLPGKWLQGSGVSRVRIFVSGENLYTWDHLKIAIDPEIQQNSVEGVNDARSFGKTYPYFRTLSCGVQIDL